MSKVKLGMNAKVFYSDDPEVEELEDVIDNELDVANVELNLSVAEADVTKRSGGGWRQTATTLNECEVTFEIPLETDDVGYQALRDAFVDGTTLAMAIISGPEDEEANEGPLGYFFITGFNRSEPIDGAINMNVTAKLETYIDWVVTETNGGD